MKNATLRGIFVGNREHFEGLMKAVGVTKMQPVVDTAFEFDQAPEAYQHLKSGRHFGKVVIKI
jgi:D-arabinose 1-dehydrogenase-like Zn-dependent alcohol dehydrogenase